ncbi:hypothetical protein BRC75_05905 [Halobacteriales archaeon QH_7_69_31]|nr:MAG: hypothetical protein BRC75_05905 [Halobacteriales archaeon QH_7_69_31]
MSGANGEVDAALEALRAGTDGPVYTLVRFYPYDFEVLYVDDAMNDLYPGGSAMDDHFERIFDYVGIDFAERALFTDVLLSGAGDVRYMTTSLDSIKVVRAYGGEDVGVFVALDPEEAVPPVVEVVTEHLL